MPLSKQPLLNRSIQTFSLFTSAIYNAPCLWSGAKGVICTVTHMIKVLVWYCSWRTGAQIRDRHLTKAVHFWTPFLILDSLRWGWLDRLLTYVWHTEFQDGEETRKLWWEHMLPPHVNVREGANEYKDLSTELSISVAKIRLHPWQTASRL